MHVGMSRLDFNRNALLGMYGMVMMGVCTLACVGPAVRALRVELTETLREDG